MAFFIFYIFIFAIIVVMLSIIHYPKHGMTPEIRKSIKSNGLMHFTFQSNFEGIKRDGIKAQGNHMQKSEKGMVWFYLNDYCIDEQMFREKLKIVRSKGKRNKYDGVVIVRNIPDELIDQLQYRYNFFNCDKAIVYRGNIKTTDMIFHKIEFLSE